MVKEVIINRRAENKIKNQFRKHVDFLRKENKYRREYKFIYYAIYLIHDEFMIEYFMNSLLTSQTDDIIGTKEEFGLAIDKYNDGRRVDNTNRSTGIDSIDKSSLLKNFNTVVTTFNPNLIEIKQSLIKNIMIKK